MIYNEHYALVQILQLENSLSLSLPPRPPCPGVKIGKLTLPFTASRTHQEETLGKNARNYTKCETKL